MPLQEDYQVALENFHGPLDLLFYLIRRAEVDIEDIPIATITDQYLAFLAGVDEVDVEVAGEFLVMAATLIEIKSRVLMPPEQRAGAGSEGETAGDEHRGLNIADPRADLIQQLLAYQRHRLAAEALHARRMEFERRYPARAATAASRGTLSDGPSGGPAGGPELRLPGEEGPPGDVELDDAHVLDLSGAYERIIASIDLSRLGDHLVEVDDTPIALHQEDLLDRLRRAPDQRLTLPAVFHGQGPAQRVGLFLASLELVRQQQIAVKQDDIDAEVTLLLVAPAAGAPSDNRPPPAPSQSGPG